MKENLSFLERFMLGEMWRKYNNYPDNNNYWIKYGNNEKLSVENLSKLDFCEMGNYFGCRITEKGIEESKKYLFNQ